MSIKWLKKTLHFLLVLFITASLSVSPLLTSIHIIHASEVLNTQEEVVEFDQVEQTTLEDEIYVEQKDDIEAILEEETIEEVHQLVDVEEVSSTYIYTLEEGIDLSSIGDDVELKAEVELDESSDTRAGPIQIQPTSITPGVYTEVTSFGSISTVDSLLWAIDQAPTTAPDNEVPFKIKVMNDILLTSLVTISPNKNILITSDTGSRELRVDVNRRHFTVSANGKLTLEGIVLDGGLTTRSSVNQGGIIVNGLLTFNTGARLQRGAVNDNGNATAGMIAVSGAQAKFTMNGGYVNNNFLNYTRQGAIYAYNNGTIIINDGEVYSNYLNNTRQAGVYGYTNSTIIINGGTFRNHTNNYGWGAGIGSENVTLFEINGGTITANSASQGGAGVVVNGHSNFVMTGGTISNNTQSSATNGGPGILFYSGGGTINGGTIKANTHNGNNAGGGIFLFYSTVVMNDGLISENSAPNGGGVAVSYNSTFTLNGGRIENNIARGTTEGFGLGGGISLTPGGTNDPSKVIINDGYIRGNTAKGSTVTNEQARHYFTGVGGGIFSQLHLTINGGNIQENIAKFGGGIASFDFQDRQDRGILTLTGGNIIGNEATRYGGGIYNGSRFTFYNGSIVSNSALIGGGVYNELDMTMYKGLIQLNKASASAPNGLGGGIYNVGDLIIYSGTINNNTARLGGGIYHDDDPEDSFTSFYTKNNDLLYPLFNKNYASEDGGAIFLTCPLSDHIGISAVTDFIGNSAGNPIIRPSDAYVLANHPQIVSRHSDIHTNPVTNHEIWIDCFVGEPVETTRSVEIIKIDDTGATLSSINFEIYQKVRDSFELIDSVITDSNGLLTFETTFTGSTTIKIVEITNPYDYVLYPLLQISPLMFDIDADGNITNVSYIEPVEIIRVSTAREDHIYLKVGDAYEAIEGMRYELNGGSFFIAKDGRLFLINQPVPYKIIALPIIETYKRNYLTQEPIVGAQFIVLDENQENYVSAVDGAGVITWLPYVEGVTPIDAKVFTSSETGSLVFTGLPFNLECIADRCYTDRTTSYVIREINQDPNYMSLVNYWLLELSNVTIPLDTIEHTPFTFTPYVWYNHNGSNKEIPIDLINRGVIYNFPYVHINVSKTWIDDSHLVDLENVSARVNLYRRGKEEAIDTRVLNYDNEFKTSFKLPSVYVHLNNGFWALAIAQYHLRESIPGWTSTSPNLVDGYIIPDASGNVTFVNTRDIVNTILHKIDHHNKVLSDIQFDIYYLEHKIGYIKSDIDGILILPVPGDFEGVLVLKETITKQGFEILPDIYLSFKGGHVISIATSATNVINVEDGNRLSHNNNVIVLVNVVNSINNITIQNHLRNYTITYDLNGGSNHEDNPSTYTIESSEIVLGQPSRTGYEFVRWEEKGVITTGIPTGSTGDRVFTAIWEVVKYDITYILDGGTNHEDNPDSYSIESDDIVLLDPERRGYTFAGWTDEQGQGTTGIPSGSVGNREFTANWRVTEYSINYVMNGGTNHPSNPLTYTITSTPITLENPTRLGYTFLHWEDNDGNVTTGIEAGGIGDRQFFAIWQVNQYNITYDLGIGGINHSANPSTYTINSDFITLQNPTRPGYTFVGWNPVGTIPSGSTGDRHFVALWQALLTVTFMDNTVVVDTQSVTYGDLASLITLPVREGYDFVGWYQLIDGVLALEAFDFSTLITEDVVLYAVWQVHQLEVDPDQPVEPGDTDTPDEPSDKDHGDGPVTGLEDDQPKPTVTPTRPDIVQTGRLFLMMTGLLVSIGFIGLSKRKHY